MRNPLHDNIFGHTQFLHNSLDCSARPQRVPITAALTTGSHLFPLYTPALAPGKEVGLICGEVQIDENTDSSMTFDSRVITAADSK